MKTHQPLILTARIATKDLEPFDRLRREHFPPDRNSLRAHLTMFHRLPGERRQRIVEQLIQVATVVANSLEAEVEGLRHLGAGVAYAVASPSLENIHSTLKTEFISWLGPQDMKTWLPHITVQNKVSPAKADALFAELSHKFRAHRIEIEGLDLWEYLGGPWRHVTFLSFGH